MIDLFSEEMRRNPYPVYDQLRANSPVLHVPAFDAWMILDFDGVKQALSDHSTFGSRLPGGSPRWLLFADPPRHTKLRALILKAFTPRVVAGLEPRIRELSRRLLDDVIEGGEMDLAADFTVPLPTMVIAEMLGIPSADRARFKRWGDVILNLSHAVAGGETESQVVAAVRAVTAEMAAYMPDIVADRKARPRDDLLTRLAQAEVDGERLTDDDIVNFVQPLLVAGSETTTNLLNNAILCFLEYPDQLARVRAAPALLPSAIEEVLRYRSPGQWSPRGTTRDVEVHGQVIPADKVVLLVIGSANRDPKQFPDANRFDVARDPNPHIAFGHGIHFCLGAPLARLEARIALTDLLGRLNGLERTTSEPWEPRKALNVHGPARLPIRFQKGRRIQMPA